MEKLVLLMMLLLRNQLGLLWVLQFYSCVKKLNMKKLILLFIKVDVKPNITVDQTIDLHIDGENVDGLEGEWVITTDEDNDVITIKIEKKEEEIQ